jgi:peroxin-3
MQDCTYTIMALLPTLGTRILEELDVECISLELQSRSAKHQRPSVQPRLPTLVPITPLSGENLLASTPIVISHDPLQSHGEPAQDVGSPFPSNVALSINGEDATVDPMAQSMTSWATASEAVSAPTMINAESIEADPNQRNASGASVIIDPLAESTASAVVKPLILPCIFIADLPLRQFLSMRSTTSQSGASPALAPTSNSTSIDAHSMSDSPYPPHPLAQKSKAELWADLKLQTFTRTLTIIYAISLLSLQTHVQLNLLGRARYLQSVRALEREERAKEGLGLGEMLFFGGQTVQLENEEEERVDKEEWEEVDEVVERKYLTVSWWLLHIGWRELAERVRVAVEGVVDGCVLHCLPLGGVGLNLFGRVSLKTRLGIDDIRTLINQVRLKVEETEEGSDGPRAEYVFPFLLTAPLALNLLLWSFTPTLLPPPDSSEEQNVLIQGGISPHLAEIDPPLRKLLDEMRGYISSAEFSFVLGKSVERGVEVLLDGLVRLLLSCRTILLLLMTFIGQRRPEYWSWEDITPRVGAAWGGSN